MMTEQEAGTIPEPQYLAGLSETGQITLAVLREERQQGAAPLESIIRYVRETGLTLTPASLSQAMDATLRTVYQQSVGTKLAWTMGYVLQMAVLAEYLEAPGGQRRGVFPNGLITETAALVLDKAVRARNTEQSRSGCRRIVVEVARALLGDIASQEDHIRYADEDAADCETLQRYISSIAQATDQD